MRRRDKHTNRVASSIQRANPAPSQTMFCDEEVSQCPLISASFRNHLPCRLFDVVIFVIFQGILILAKVHFLRFAELCLVV